MKTIIHPAEASTCIVSAYGYIAVHVSDSQAVLYAADGIENEPVSEVPESLPALALHTMGLITREEYEAREPGEKRRIAEMNLRLSQKRAVELAQQIARQQAEIEAMEGSE